MGSLIDRLRPAAAQIAEELGLRLVVLFGSTARSHASPEDVDLAVLGAGSLDPIVLTNRFTVLLGRDDVDVVDLHRADPVLLLHVARDGIPRYERAPGEHAAFYSLATRRFADTRKFREAEREMIRAFVARGGPRR